jgi:hypothetical protein
MYTPEKTPEKRNFVDCQTIGVNFGNEGIHKASTQNL